MDGGITMMPRGTTREGGWYEKRYFASSTHIENSREVRDSEKKTTPVRRWIELGIA